DAVERVALGPEQHLFRILQHVLPALPPPSVHAYAERLLRPPAARLQKPVLRKQRRLGYILPHKRVVLPAALHPSLADLPRGGRRQADVPGLESRGHCFSHDKADYRFPTHESELLFFSNTR